jgi:hypothetical protein
LSDARHFVILFRDHRLQYRAVYMYIHDTDIIEKLHGIGPNTITEIMVEKWYKYVVINTDTTLSMFIIMITFLDTIPVVNVMHIYLFDIFLFNAMQ